MKKHKKPFQNAPNRIHTSDKTRKNAFEEANNNEIC